MEFLIDSEGKVISENVDTWADKHDDCFIDTFFGDHKTHPSPESLKAALKYRNKRKKEIRASGNFEIECDVLKDDIEFNPPRTTAYILSAFKPKPFIG